MGQPLGKALEFITAPIAGLFGGLSGNQQRKVHSVERGNAAAQQQLAQAEQLRQQQFRKQEEEMRKKSEENNRRLEVERKKLEEFQREVARKADEQSKMMVQVQQKAVEDANRRQAEYNKKLESIQAQAAQNLRESAERQRQLQRQNRRDMDRLQEQFRSERAKDRAEMQKMQEQNRDLLQQLLKAQQEAKEKMDPAKYEEFEAKHFEKYLDAVGNLKPVQKTKKFSIAFVGTTCAGKTTLINTLVGRKCGKPSPLVNTKGVNVIFQSDQVEFYDVFGSNDSETYFNFKILQDLKTIHLVICLYVDSVEHVKKLARLLYAAGAKVHFTYSKIDMVDEEDRKMVLDNDTKVLQEVCYGCSNGQHSSKKMVGIEALRGLCHLPPNGISG